MYAYGKDYIMGMMKKQGELSAAPEGALHREGLEKMLVGKMDRDATPVGMPLPRRNSCDEAVIRSGSPHHD